MIATQRAYELNSKAIQTSDQMLQRWGSCDEHRPRPVPSWPAAVLAPLGGCLAGCRTACIRACRWPTPAPAARSRRWRRCRRPTGHLPGRQLPAAVRGPPRPAGRRHADGADRREGQRQPEEHQFGRQAAARIDAGITALPGVKSGSPARAGCRKFGQHLRRQGHHREFQRLHRHHHRGRARGAAQRPPAGGRREADRRQRQRRRAALLRPGRPARHPAGQQRAQHADRQRALEQRGRGAQADAQAIGWLAASS
jgi:hypothetical protein